jgi:hypothetical protein
MSTYNERKERQTMRVMVLMKASKESEAGVLPTTELLTAMGKFNEELVKAGVLLAGEGLHPSSKGKRIDFGAGKVTVMDGPFTETKELVAGFWLWQVKSMDEAVEWTRRMAEHVGKVSSPGSAGQVEIRPAFEPADFGPALTPELKESEERMRAKTAAKK